MTNNKENNLNSNNQPHEQDTLNLSIQDSCPPDAENNHSDQSFSSAEIENLKEEIALLKDKLLRNAAENENYKKRMEKTVEDASKYAVSNFAKELIVVMDNLQRALDSFKQISNNDQTNSQYLESIEQGIEMTKKEFLNSFLKFGVIMINPKPGENFDHNLHQAVSQIESDQYESGKIASVLQVGYIIHDRLLRAAMVAVAK